MSRSAQIDYSQYAEFMRGALSGPEICNKDLSLNHEYFNTKKGFYWNQKNHEDLINGLLAHDLDLQTIRKDYYQNSKSLVELELRACLLFNVKDIKQVTDKELKELKKTHSNAKKSASK